MATPNVVVCGEAGAGKSSLVNMIAGDAVAQVSNRAVSGCTFQSTCFTVNIGDKQFNLLDTGVNLLVFCMRSSGFRDSCFKNWQSFWDIICQRRVPIILAVTGLENEEGMDNWWTRNEEHFMTHGMYPNGVACMTATRGRRRRSGDGNNFDEEYKESQEKITRMISKVYFRTPWQVPALEWFKMIVEVSFRLESTCTLK
ncbi:hypothetical protein F5887DRAFT_920680 [Amanita rubescens]|nr:hypothetical protein F5887DRAFT_920680 [Amanita rubescens]